MEPLSRTERAALCNTALETGEEAPTLCEGWNVKDLVIHLLVRERDPLGMPGIVFPPLEGLTERSARRLADAGLHRPGRAAARRPARCGHR